MNFSEYNGRKEKKILLCQRISNGNALRRIRNVKDGEDSVNMRSLSVENIATELVTAYGAYRGKEVCTAIPAEVGEIIMEQIWKNGEYAFFPHNSISKQTVRELAECCREIRLSHTTERYNAENGGKLGEIKAIISAYEEVLWQKSYADYPMILSKALTILDELKEEPTKETLYFLLPWLDQALIGDLETNCWYDRERDFIQGLTEAADAEKTACETVTFLEEAAASGGGTDYRFCEAYGISNEIQEVIRQIDRYEQTEVIFPDPVYLNFIEAAFDAEGIPYVVQNGNPARELSFVRMMLAAVECASNDFLYADFKKVVNNRLVTFEQLEEDAAGSVSGAYYKALREGIGWGHRRYLAYWEKVSKEFENEDSEEETDLRPLWFAGMLKDFILVFYDEENTSWRSLEDIYGNLLAFARRYTYRKNMEFMWIRQALEDKKASIRYVDDAGWTLGEKLDYIRDYLENLTYEKENDRTSVLVRKLGGPDVIERENVFYVGMSVRYFSLGVRQSPILSDEEKCICLGLDRDDLDSPIDLACNRNIKRNRDLRNSLKTINGGRATFLYSSYNTVELMECAPSVCFVELANGRPVEKAAGYDYIRRNVRIEQRDMQESLAEVPVKERGEYAFPDPLPISASAIQTFLSCPLKYYYQYMCHLQSEDQLEKNNSEWLNASARGNLFHRVMERYMTEAMPPGAALSRQMDGPLFERLYAETIREMEREIPYPTEVIREHETRLYHDRIMSFIEREHAKWVSELAEGRPWQVFGCEKSFDGLLYEGQDPEDENVRFRLSLKGFIDRVDAFVDDDNVLNLRIIDYKTGRKEKKEEEVEREVQIQHDLYVCAMLDYIEMNKPDIAAHFGRSEISDVKIVQVAYVFPYEQPVQGDPEYDTLDVTAIVEEHMERPEDAEARVRLPESVAWKLSRVIAPLQAGDPDGGIRGLKSIVDEEVEELRLEKEDPDPLKEVLDSFCGNRYCNYRNVCGKWV